MGLDLLIYASLNGPAGNKKKSLSASPIHWTLVPPILEYQDVATSITA
jgi:hypothetical protein